MLDHVRSNAVAYLALFVALGGTSAWAADKITSEDIAKNAVRSKHIKKGSVETSEIATRSVTADKLAKDAGNLFAYIRDEGGADTANVAYGSGVSAVSDPGGDTSYRVTFNRSLVKCVVQAVPGYGDPEGSAALDEEAIPVISMPNGDDNQVDVFFEDAVSGLSTDTAFLITAFC
jgi:hypothetical protein